MGENLIIFESCQLQIQTTRSWDYMGFSLKVPRNPIVESDIIIGHLDGGVLPELESFSDHNLGPIPKKWKGVCNGGKNFVCNKKVIGARYYLEDSALDIFGHGTHTASTAVGRVVKNANFFGIANGTARGGVPSARIATYKVCGGESCEDKDILAAFDDAIADGVDIICASLGSTEPLKISKSSIAIGSFHAMEKDVLTVQSAGNTHSYGLKTVISIAPWLFTAAASSIDRNFVNKLVLGNGRTIISSAVNSFATGKHNLKLIYGKGIGSHCNVSSAMQCIDGCIDPNLVKGNIIVCDADEVFSDIVLRAWEVNASGVILRKNKYAKEPLTSPLPTASLYEPDFRYIEYYLNSETFPSARILKSETFQDYAPIVGSFSKKGPNKFFPEIFKPDITAPGTNILAECPVDSLIPLKKYGVKYSILTGTSMSSPHVVGAAAYVKSRHPDWSASAIKSSLMTTAWTMNKKYNVDAELGYGAGHIDPVKAAHPGLAMPYRGSPKPNALSLGQMVEMRELQLFVGKMDVNVTTRRSMNY
ncbi:subtilisin-like protease SBT4.6 [Impatiens glandulifera]|uniref:subtilisin-like protease SBT4.6 n=1 Tax=Impatiens glandulifera TaxID=253017 RepID=UPI001FB12675|nr:subtilisin-like protease SBT4.6 [Impatiens glandulifera]